MATVKMNKLSVIGMNDEKQTLLRELMDLGVVEVSKPEDWLQDEEWKKLVVRDGDETAVAEFDKKISAADTAISLLDRYDSSKKPMFPARRVMSEAEFKEIQSKENDFAEKVNFLNSCGNKITDAYAKVNSAEALKLSLEPWNNYDIPIDLTSTDSLSIRIGLMPLNTNVEGVANELEAAGHSSVFESINKDKEQQYVMLWYFKADEDEVMDAVKRHGFTQAPIADLKGTVEENLAQADRTIDEANKEIGALEQRIKSMSDVRTDVESYHDMMAVEHDRAYVRSRLLTTDETFTFDGWTPKYASGKVEKLLEKYTCWYELTEPEENDDVPVRLQNKKFFAPIEFITEMYSLPNWKEIDPTSIFAIFYIIFFGIMFGDVGYGIILCVMSVYAIKKNKLYEGGPYKLLRVLFYSGISSIFWGIMFGSFFGDLIPVVAKTFFGKTVVINPLWLDPAKSPMIFLVFSCGLGVIHLFVGMGIKAYQQIRDGKVLEACKDVFAWYLIVSGIILMLFGTRVAPGAPKVGKIMTIVGVAAAILLPFIVNKGVTKGLGIWDIYSGLTGNLSDILSYSRLLGLGLASTSIAQVFNFLASMGGKSIVGVVMFLVIAILGHTLNFGINALGAFVHSCRLQYVEFFGKFYEGEGRAFEPLSRDTKYINIIKEAK